MQCPVCDVALTISSREAIEIDHCPQCRGVWLDRGELDKIIERSALTLGGGGDRDRRSDRDDDRPRYRDDDRPRYRDDDRPRYDDRSRKKRRGSFLEDIFDFD